MQLRIISLKYMAQILIFVDERKIEFQFQLL